MEITIKATKTKAVLNFMIIGVSIKASTEVSIDYVINPYSEPTKELVIRSHKNMNKDNNK